MSRTEEYRALREQGLTYREIAARFGVTHQTVAQVCAKSKDTQFRRIRPQSCIYPALRKWMNDNLVSRAELYRRMHNGNPCIGRAPYVIRERMVGRTLWRLDEIEKLLDITGMTFEELFRGERHGSGTTEDGMDGD